MTEGHTERLEAALDGKYLIERKLGEGGMATVYLARDVKHERKVALKILKPELAAVIGAERFLSEIKTTANLQHPHILPLFDSGEASGYLYYVMPYIDGETLRDKLDREKQLGVEESVRIARDVADALDYAHRQGVIHRDIKPANILLHDGRPVVADFGIALAVSAAGGGRMTETGLSLGTPHYMSPEQASADRDLSARSDVYSLGCVLYEMIGGQPPHSGPSAQSILVHILTKEATPLTELRHTVPPHVAATVAKAIEKLPADRFETAKQFMEALGDQSFTYQTRPGAATTVAAAATAPLAVAGQRRNRPAMAFASLFGITALALGWSLLQPEPPQPVQRLVLSTDGWLGLDGPAPGRFVALAPDGSSMIVPIESPSGEVQFAVKMRDGTAITPILGTEGGQDVVYSPDGRSIAYSIGRELFRQAVQGGAPVRLAEDAENGTFALDWLDDGTILYETEVGTDRRIVQIPEDGGEARVVFELEEEIAPIWVHGLPGGRGALVSVCPGGSCAASSALLHLVDLQDLSWELIEEGVPRAWYTPTGHLVYVRSDGAVFAEPFDLATLEITGSAVPIFQGARVAGSSPDMRVAADGTLLYVEGSAVGGSGGLRLVVVDLEGNQEPLLLSPRDIRSVSWSPDGRTVAYPSSESFGGSTQIYTYDVVLNTPPRQLTFEGTNIAPVFSPDGTRLAFTSRRPGTDQADLFVKNLEDNAAERSIITLVGAQRLTQWPSDSLMVFEQVEGQGDDLWMVDLSDPDNPRAEAYLTSEADLGSMVISPDGTLAAYGSNESGDTEIYINSFPVPGAPTKVSEDGGDLPSWSPDGNTLYYATGAGRPWMAASLQRSPVPRVLAIRELFTLTGGGPAPFPGSGLHPEGDRFILARNAVTYGAGDGDAEPARLILVQNFFEELRQRVGAN